MKAVIIMATHNGENYIGEQLDSICSQTFKNIILYISDSSKDLKTKTIIDKYFNILNIKYFKYNYGAHIKVSENKVTLNFENALYKYYESADYSPENIVFLADQDDVWANDKISKHIKEYEEDKEVALVYNNSMITDFDLNPKTSIDKEIPGYFNKRKIAHYAWGSAIIGCSLSFKSKYLKKILPIPKELPGHDNYILAVLNNKKEVFIDEILQYWRRHDNNYSLLENKDDMDVRMRINNLKLNNVKNLKTYVFKSKIDVIDKMWLATILFVKSVKKFFGVL